jgi:dTDP-4-amino-4,6-dideoxygalactose transaminase
VVQTEAVIRFNDFTRESAQVLSDMAIACERVIQSGHYVLGAEVQAFENEWAIRCGSTEAVGVANGLDAIEVGIRALGIGSGDEVITTPMTAVASVLGIVRSGAVPVLADIDPSTGLLSVESAERCVTHRTRAVMPVHLYGRVGNMLAWQSFCLDHGLTLVEDCAQSHDASVRNRVAGTWGAVGAYSFYPTKNLGAVGDAGAIVTSDPEVADRARSMRNYGQTTRYVHDVIGLNSRLDELQAAILRVRLPHLAEATARRRAIATNYVSGINNPVVSLLSPPADTASHVHHLFVVLAEHRSALQNHMTGSGIETLIHYPIPVHRQWPFLQVERDPTGLSNSERHGEQCLSLPCAPHLTDAECDRVVEAVNSFRP